MTSLKLKGLEEAKHDAIIRSIGNYKKVGIEIDISELDSDNAVKITQAKMYNGLILSSKQLYERAKKVFHGSGIKPRIIPLTYSLDFSNVTTEWIEEQMKEYSISRKDIVKQLGIAENVVSEYLSGKRNLSLMGKAAFYYYFLTYELNTELRTQ